MKILFGTPVHGASVCLGYHESVVNMLSFFWQEFPGIYLENRSIQSSVLPLARNTFASMVLNDPSYSHLLFIDTDMGFSPALIARMIAFQKPVVGVVSPKKKFNYEWFHASRALYDDPMVARLLANDYIGGQGALVTTPGPNGERQAQLVDGFVQVRYAGTGIMLIHRDVFVTIKERFPELWVEQPGEQVRGFGLEGGLLQCFDAVQGSDGLFPGEDLAFCRRWVDGCGGEMWSCVDEVIVHIGYQTYLGQYMLKLQHGESLFQLPAAAESPPANAEGSKAA